jgi:solute carrier family 13 (sodium-dependent dicarboxylate transporter), member 2/3/5
LKIFILPLNVYIRNVIQHRLFILLGPLLFAISCLLIPFYGNVKTWIALGTIAWMLTWWLSEIIPMAVTALLPILIFSASNIMTLDQCLISYSDKYVFLFLAGFMLALAIEKWDLHHVFAQWIISKTGQQPKAILAGLMITTYFVSMWISNTATAIMMIPMALAMTTSQQHQVPAAIKKVTVLGIAYSASIGGMATLLGSPPNAAMAGILAKDFNTPVSFWDWFKWGFPFSILLLIIGFFLLTQLVSKKDWADTQFNYQVKKHQLTFHQKKTLLIFITTAALWVFQSPISGLLGSWFNDTAIGLAMSFFLFVSWNNQPLIQWEETKSLPWGILLMFGGGLCLANGFKSSGILDWIANAFAQHQHLSFGFIVILCATGLFLTALMSNLAMVAIFIPIVGAIAMHLDVSPVLLAIPVTLASSCDFMFPMSTPPNAIAYSSGHVSARQMFSIGLLFNLCALILLVIWMMLMT